LGEVIPFIRPGSDFRRWAVKLERLGAQTAETAANCKIVSEHLASAVEHGQQVRDLLGSFCEAMRKTTEFCRRCRDASELDDLAAMIEQRDRLARELLINTGLREIKC